MPSNLMSSIHTNLKETPGGAGMIVTDGISSNLNGVVFHGAACIDNEKGLVHHNKVNDAVHTKRISR